MPVPEAATAVAETENEDLIRTRPEAVLSRGDLNAVGDAARVNPSLMSRGWRNCSRTGLALDPDLGCFVSAPEKPGVSFGTLRRRADGTPTYVAVHPLPDATGRARHLGHDGVQRLPQVVPRPRIEPGGGFVEEEHLGSGDKRRRVAGPLDQPLGFDGVFEGGSHAEPGRSSNGVSFTVGCLAPGGEWPQTGRYAGSSG